MIKRKDLKNDAGTDAFRDEYVHALEAEIERLRAIVDKSPKTADGVLIKPEMIVWLRFQLPTALGGRSGIRCDKVYSIEFCENGFVRINLMAESCKKPNELFSTRKAAEAAKKVQ